MKVADRIKSMTLCYSNGGYSRRGGEVFDVGNREIIIWFPKEFDRTVEYIYDTIEDYKIRPQ
jgi:hypothetical protein